MLFLEPYPHQRVFLIVLQKREIRRAQKLLFFDYFSSHRLFRNLVKETQRL